MSTQDKGTTATQAISSGSPATNRTTVRVTNDSNSSNHEILAAADKTTNGKNVASNKKHVKDGNNSTNGKKPKPTIGVDKSNPSPPKVNGNGANGKHPPAQIEHAAKKRKPNVPAPAANPASANTAPQNTDRLPRIIQSLNGQRGLVFCAQANCPACVVFEKTVFHMRGFFRQMASHLASLRGNLRAPLEGSDTAIRKALVRDALLKSRYREFEIAVKSTKQENERRLRVVMIEYHAGKVETELAVFFMRLYVEYTRKLEVVKLQYLKDGDKGRIPREGSAYVPKVLDGTLEGHKRKLAEQHNRELKTRGAITPPPPPGIATEPAVVTRKRPREEEDAARVVERMNLTDENMRALMESIREAAVDASSDAAQQLQQPSGAAEPKITPRQLQSLWQRGHNVNKRRRVHFADGDGGDGDESDSDGTEAQKQEEPTVLLSEQAHRKKLVQTYACGYLVELKAVHARMVADEWFEACTEASEWVNPNFMKGAAEDSEMMG